MNDKMTKEIIFNSTHPDSNIRCFSNFYPCKIMYGGIKFNHVEGAFQAAKVKNEKDKLNFVNVTPQAAKKMGGAKGKYRMDNDSLERWMNGERIEVMRRLLHEKFKDPYLRQVLLNTGESRLVERLPRFPDAFWGTKKDGSGENMLGQLLMEVRTHNRENSTQM